jgi:hypothetical protein
MHITRQARRFTIPAIASFILCLVVLPSPLAFPGCGVVRAQSSQGTELDEILFVQTPEHDNAANPGIDVAWIPEPLLKICLGKTLQQCSAMDFCIRTTSKQVAMCRNLAIPLSRLPSSFPPGMRPRRVMSLSFYKITASGPYGPLQDFYKSLPRSSLQRLSLDARIKARIRFTREPDDDDFQFEQLLATAPF